MLHGQTVLIVDDDASVLHAVENIVRRGGYSPVVASDPVDALEKLNQAGHVGLLLTDFLMPHMDGVAFARKALVMCPEIRVLLMSALQVSSPFPFVRKPFGINELLEEVRKSYRWSCSGRRRR